MKKIILILSSFATFIAAAQTDVKLNIQHLFNSAPLAFDTSIESPQPDELKITRLQYYISGIKLIHDGGQETEVSDAFLLVNANNNNDYSIGNFNITDLESIEFGIGVVQSENHKDPSLYPANHALAPQMQSMHWGWSSGYRFIALEGKAGTNFANLFQFHALGDANFHIQTISTTGQTSGSDLTIELDADYYTAFNSISVSDGPIEHGEQETGCLQLINNFKTSVFSERVSAPVGLNEEELVFSLYPNPVTDVLNISIPELENGESDKLSYQIVDLLGRRVLGNSLTTNSIQINELNNGLYFLELKDDSSILGRQSFLVKQ